MRLSTRLVTTAWDVYWFGLFVATHIPIPEGAPSVRHADKVLHVVAYFGLTALGGWRLAALRGAPSAKTIWSWAAVYALYGVVDESLQPLVGRSMTLGDLLADAVGVTAATLLIVRISLRRLSERHR
jgi:VanZ family protein